MSKVLITGGAGFIGSHLADELLERGHEVAVLDCLSPQVHGERRARPGYLAEGVELLEGDVRDAGSVRRALRGVDAVYHFAAAVGVGQSMHEIRHYVDVNGVGTAVLLEALVERPVPRLVVASSASIYGEGLYHDSRGRPCQEAQRDPARLKEGKWDPRGSGRRAARARAHARAEAAQPRERLRAEQVRPGAPLVRGRERPPMRGRATLH